MSKTLAEQSGIGEQLLLLSLVFLVCPCYCNLSVNSVRSLWRKIFWLLQRGGYMGILDYPFVDLVPAVRSWFRASVSGDLDMPFYCYECRSLLPASGCGYRCRSCGRLFCRKCMIAGSDLHKFCRICFHAFGNRAAAEAQSLPASPLSRFGNSRLSHSTFSSPRSSRSDDEEDGDGSGKRFFSASSSELSQEVSDVDSVSISTGLEIHSFKSVDSTPSESPCKGAETTRDNSPFDREVPGYFRKTGAETEDLLENSRYDSFLVCREHENQKVQQPLDIENNKLIWDPPLPEDENDDVENDFFGYNDEEDEGDPSSDFSSGSFSCHSLSIREKPNDAQKEKLRNAAHRQFRALVSQLLREEGLQDGNEDNGKGWVDVVSSLAWQAATFVRPDTRKGSSMDPGDYVKVKRILCGRPSDSTLVKGVVCTKNVKHKRMVSQHKSARLFLLGGALEYQRVTNKLASIDTVLEQEIDHLNASLSKIEAHRPNVLLVEKSVSSYAQEYLLKNEISLVLNVKRKLLERIARCTNAQIAPSIESIGSARLGHCNMFRVEKFSEDCSFGSNSNRKTMKTLMYFEGCPQHLGCTVLLHGTHPEELKKVKNVVQYASFAAYHLSREKSFLADEGAALRHVPLNLPIAEASNVLDSDTTILKTSTSNILARQSRVCGEHEKLGRCSNNHVSYFFTSSGVPSLQGDITSSDISQLIGDFATRLIETSEPFAYSSDGTKPKEVMGNMTEEERNLKLYKEPEAPIELKRIGTDGEKVDRDYFSTSDSQSILVSLSTANVLKETICEPSQLYRIKFYGSFDKPLGRFLRDDLFDQAYCCWACKEPAEAHVRCYTHQHGSLTINVRRHPSVKLRGERDGRIWMWHRCLKCEHCGGVPPAARRVIISDAAWGLSFGKFLELSFSNHATANRVASCGHSLQKDCLRFFGSGSMVAFFRYSPVDILSVRLPPLVLDFTSANQQEWAKEEADAISSKIEFLQGEVNDVLQAFERRIATSDYEPVKTSIYKYIMELKDLLKRERNEYDVLLQPSAIDCSPFQETIDVLELNRLRRFLLIDSHMWERRLCLLDSFSKSKSPLSTSNHRPQFSKPANQIIKDWKVQLIDNDGNFIKSPEEVFLKPVILSRRDVEVDLCAFSGKPNNLVATDWSIDSVEGYVGSAALSMVSHQYYLEDYQTEAASTTITESSSLERLPSAASVLSDKIDCLWCGNPDADEIGSINLMDNTLYRKVISPLRVNSFDSALRSRDKSLRGLPPESFHLSSVRSFDTSGHFTSLDISQRSPRSKRLNFIPSGNRAFISSTNYMVGEGARLLLPQTGNDDLVIVLYENEPSTIISYAISSQDHADFVMSDHQMTDKGIGWPRPSQFQSDEEPHFRVSFDDECSIPEDKVKFSVTCYFAKQFAALRKKCCPDGSDLLRSLSRCKRWNAQGGKSNVYFAKSFDERFILKQVTKTELDSFEVFAPEYFRYMAESMRSGSPTCLAKVLGVYQVTVRHLNSGREVKTDLMMMENLFFGRTLSKVYDLKGSLRARYNPDTSRSDSVLLDLNLLESVRTKPIFLGSKAKRSLERAVWNDTSFLASVDVMDYSLLVGVDDERQELVVGIIDFMRQYTWDKHLETWVKASGILGGSKNESPTVVSPLQYKKRFRKAMSKYFLTVPDQWSSS